MADDSYFDAQDCPAELSSTRARRAFVADDALGMGRPARCRSNLEDEWPVCENDEDELAEAVQAPAVACFA